MRLLLLDLGIPFIVIPPTTLKKWATGSGTADKIAMAVATFEEWGLKFNDDNQCDSFNLAVVTAAYSGQPIGKVNAERKKILDSLRDNPLSRPKRKAK